MGRMKDWAMDEAEKKINNILAQFTKGKATREEARKKLLDDETLDIFGGVNTTTVDDILDREEKVSHERKN